MTSTRPLRADAARNRELLLAAAADEFAEHGLDASVTDIARRAGVGKGTVFRHFPTKDDLIAAIVLDRIAMINAIGERLLEAADSGDALLRFLTAAAEQREQRDLSFLQGASRHDPEVARVHARFLRIVDALVDRARRHGAVRADVTGADAVLLMCAPNHVAGSLPNAPPDLWRRYLMLIFDGLRPEGAHELPQPPPTISSGGDA